MEHLIIYNVTGIDEVGVETMFEEGRCVLGAIPGVREVVTGKAVKEDAKYRYTWLVRFCHPAVIESYREHPDHVAFADNRFRPVAGERISIDYQTVEPVVLRSNVVERSISKGAIL
ncbi:MAG: Dabb family protein [Pseudomonadota bacterium]